MAPSDRRGFLRGLVTLPLIGGSVALIGNPVRAAQVATPEQLLVYAAFAVNEMRQVLELVQAQGVAVGLLPGVMERHRDTFPDKASVTVRAPVILSAAGVPLIMGGKV